MTLEIWTRSHRRGKKWREEIGGVRTEVGKRAETMHGCVRGSLSDALADLGMVVLLVVVDVYVKKILCEKSIIARVLMILYQDATT